MTLQLIRINDVAISVAKLNRISLDLVTNEVKLSVKDKPRAFSFSEENPEKASALYWDICKLVRATQESVPFITFGAVTFRLDHVTAIYLELNSVVVSTLGFLPEVIKFNTDEAAKLAFDEIMVSLGLAGKADSDVQADKLKVDDSPKPKKTKKPPDKVPRKAAQA